MLWSKIEILNEGVNGMENKKERKFIAVLKTADKTIADAKKSF